MWGRRAMLIILLYSIQFLSVRLIQMHFGSGSYWLNRLTNYVTCFYGIFSWFYFFSLSKWVVKTLGLIYLKHSDFILNSTYTSFNAGKGLSCGWAISSQCCLSCEFHTGENELALNKWLIYLSRHMMMGHTLSQAYVSPCLVSEITGV